MMEGTSAPPLALTFAYWLHMLATVVWIGGLTTMALLVIPAARKTLSHPEFGNLISRIQARLSQIGWFSLAVLTVTGMFQMSSHPSYEGFLTFSNAWALAILSKHLVIGLMIVVSAYITWGLLPALQRVALLQGAGKQVDDSTAESLKRREMRLLQINLALSFVVLALTALARTSG
jgi:uncharacterized membrane protein